MTIEVKESSNKPPVFRQGPGAEISLSEGSEDFGNIIATYTADSQIPGDPQVYFELVNGRTEQTNKEATFRAVVNRDNQNQVDIYQAKKLEYERVNEYTLTIQVRNNPDLVAEAQLNIKVSDENNQAPVFTNIESGSVLEHERPGTTVMHGGRTDGYYLVTKVMFDREEQKEYQIPVRIEDNKGMAATSELRLVIGDVNDNPMAPGASSVFVYNYEGLVVISL